MQLQDPADGVRHTGDRFVVIDHDGFRVLVSRELHALDESGFAFEIARPARFLGQHDQPPMAEPEQNAGRVTAHGAVIEITERQVESRVRRTRHDTRESSFLLNQRCTVSFASIRIQQPCGLRVTSFCNDGPGLAAK